MVVCGTNDNSLRKRLLRESELTLPKAISAGHTAEETRKHARRFLKVNATIDLYRISKHSKSRSQTSTHATGIIKKCKFCENSHHRGKCLPRKRKFAIGKVCHKEKFAITVIGKTILRTTVHVIEKLSMKLNKPKLNHLLLTNTNFPLIRYIFKKNLKTCFTFLRSKMNPPIGILLYHLMVLQYPIK